MKIFQLESIINAKLRNHTIKDYVANGLQIEGQEKVGKIVTGVTASLAFIEEAIKAKANTILVHHGYFWKNESPLIVGMKRNRIKRLLAHEINLLAYHLPLDVHPELGNNAQLAKKWEIQNIKPMDEGDPLQLVLQGEFTKGITGDELSNLISTTLQRVPFHCGDNAPHIIKNIAWCSGAAQDYLEEAACRGMDAFITGEVSERTIHIAREMGIHFYAAGHHATERCGVKALGEWLEKTHHLEVEFIDVDNPI